MTPDIVSGPSVVVEGGEERGREGKAPTKPRRSCRYDVDRLSERVMGAIDGEAGSQSPRVIRSVSHEGKRSTLTWDTLQAGPASQKVRVPWRSKSSDELWDTQITVSHQTRRGISDAR